MIDTKIGDILVYCWNNDKKNPRFLLRTSAKEYTFLFSAETSNKVYKTAGTKEYTFELHERLRDFGLKSTII